MASPMGFGPDGGRGRPRRGSLGRAWELGQARAARIWSWAWRCVGLAGEAGPAHEGGGGRPNEAGWSWAEGGEEVAHAEGPRGRGATRSSLPIRSGSRQGGGGAGRLRRRGWPEPRRAAPDLKAGGGGGPPRARIEAGGVRDGGGDTKTVATARRHECSTAAGDGGGGPGRWQSGAAGAGG